TLSTLLLPLHQLLKTLDHLIILAHHYSTIICLTGKQLFGLSASPSGGSFHQPIGFPVPVPLPISLHCK
ncbi:hypothetical protein ILYODFUR_013176, partial [Ilyodon furcidens]